MNSEEKTGWDRLDLAEAQRIAELLKIKIDNFMGLASVSVGEGHKDVYKQAYIELLFNGVMRLNNNEDPRAKINNTKITPEVVSWYKETALALEEEEAQSEKYMAALSGNTPPEH